MGEYHGFFYNCSVGFKYHGAKIHLYTSVPPVHVCFPLQLLSISNDLCIHLAENVG